MNSKTVAIVEDEKEIINLLKIYLERENFKTKSFCNGNDFLQMLERGETVDLVILDIMLPNISGLEICKILKKKYSDIAIIILTAKQDEIDRVLGLELGADDYVVKPFFARELILRIKNILQKQNHKTVQQEVVEINNSFYINTKTFEVYIDGSPLELTTTEIKILLILANRRNWVFSRERLLDNLWGNDKIVLERTIDVHIKNLRNKLGRMGNLIKSVRGIGYKLVK